MNIDSVIKNSSITIAYLGTLGWGSAYFYGWGISYYYGFPWWYVIVGVDSIARSLFYAIDLIIVFIVSWFIGFCLFFAVKQKRTINQLSDIRLLFAVFLFVIPFNIMLTILHKNFFLKMSVIFFILSITAVIIIRTCWQKIVVIYNLYKFNRNVAFVMIMLVFMVYFWLFSFIAGVYKPQSKKEYETILHNGEWYYVLAKYNERLILSKSFMANSKRFLIYKQDTENSYEINIVKVRL